VEHHGTAGLSLWRAAEIACLEPKYFSAYFREKVGLTFSAWRRRVRVAHAQTLIRAADADMEEVASAAGFGSVRTFERAFQRCVGQTPGAFRDLVRP
jgi:two-component system response regulator YesN